MAEFNARNKVYGDITEIIGATPLVRINKLAHDEECVATILAKLEFFNPLASVKDRTALGMIDTAERNGVLSKHGTIVEATSGNTGIGLAFISAMRGYRVILTMPENMSLERQKLLAFLGAKIVLTPAAEGMYGAVKKADEITKSTIGAYMPKQFENQANPRIHYHTTAEEIWADTKGAVDAFVAGVGTGGTLQGIAMFLKERRNSIKIYAVQPEASQVLTGNTPGPHKIQGIGANFYPPLLDQRILESVISVDDDEAISFARRLALDEGILAGISSGAAIAAATRIGKIPSMRGKTVVALLPDTGERYLSSDLFDGM